MYPDLASEPTDVPVSGLYHYCSSWGLSSSPLRYRQHRRTVGSQHANTLIKHVLHRDEIRWHMLARRNYTTIWYRNDLQDQASGGHCGRHLPSQPVLDVDL